MESMISFQSKGSNYRGEIYAPIQAGHHEFKVMRVVQTNWNQFEFSAERSFEKSKGLSDKSLKNFLRKSNNSLRIVKIC